MTPHMPSFFLLQNIERCAQHALPLAITCFGSGHFVAVNRHIPRHRIWRVRLHSSYIFTTTQRVEACLDTSWQVFSELVQIYAFVAEILPGEVRSRSRRVAVTLQYVRLFNLLASVRGLLGLSTEAISVPGPATLPSVWCAHSIHREHPYSCNALSEHLLVCCVRNECRRRASCTRRRARCCESLWFSAFQEHYLEV